MRENDDHNDWAKDAIAFYVMAIQALRKRYPEEQLPGVINGRTEPLLGRGDL